ncbi:MAG: hypothetical protein ACOCXA_09460, partial [Planctomycetota bacterium]
ALLGTIAAGQAADYALTTSYVDQDGSSNNKVTVGYSGSTDTMVNVLLFPIPTDFDGGSVSSAGLTYQIDRNNNYSDDDISELVAVRISSEESVVASDYTDAGTVLDADFIPNPVDTGVDVTLDSAAETALADWLNAQTLPPGAYVVLRMKRTSPVSNSGKLHDYNRFYQLGSGQEPVLNITTGSGTIDDIQNLQALALSHESIQLTWDAVDGAVRYIVSRGTESDYSDLTEIDNDVTTNSFIDNGLTADQTYHYQVDAEDTAAP